MEILQAHDKTIEARLQLGRKLVEAKDALGHGEFMDMVKEDLPFSISVAERLMKIARDERFKDSAHGAEFADRL